MIGQYLVEAGVVFVVGIHMQFVAYPQVDQEGAGQAGGQAQQVEDSELAVLEEAAPDKLELVTEHGSVLIGAANCGPIYNHQRVLELRCAWWGFVFGFNTGYVRKSRPHCWVAACLVVTNKTFATNEDLGVLNPWSSEP